MPTRSIKIIQERAGKEGRGERRSREGKGGEGRERKRRGKKEGKKAGMERKPWNKTRSPPMTAHSFSCSGSNFSGSLDFGAGALYTFTHKKGVYTNPATSPAAAPRRLLRSRFRRAREGKKPGTQERG